MKRRINWMTCAIIISLLLQASICYGAIVKTGETGDRENEQNIVSKNQLYKAKKVGSVVSHKERGYDIEINGKEILNPNNELRVIVDLQKKGEKYIFDVNDGKPLPGPVKIKWKKNVEKEYVFYYHYDQNSNKYDYIGTSENDKSIDISIPGKYIISKRKIGENIFETKPIIVIGLISVFSVILYILLNKKYWVW